MQKGKVVEINRSMGYGFILTEDGQRIFFHQRWLRQLRFKDLDIGTELVFVINQGPRGPRAHNIMRPSDVPISRQERIAELLFKE